METFKPFVSSVAAIRSCVWVCSEMEEWEDDGDDGDCLSHHDWDLENALASAILGDVGSLPETAAPVAFRDEAEEERLIERLHARLFPVRKAPRSTSSSRSSISSFTTSQAIKEKPRAAVAGSQSKAQAPPVEPTQSHESTPRLAISPEKVDEMLARFRLQEAKRHRKLTLLLQQQQHDQSPVTSSSTSSVSTVVSPRSRELTQGLPSFQQRQALALAKRERELSIRRQQQERQQSPQPLALAVQKPCLCGADGRRDHSRACERFMETCGKLNATSEIHRKKLQMRRSVADLMRLHEESKQKQRAIADLQRQRELRDATFMPQINPVSIKIYEDLVESGRLQGRSSCSRPVETTAPQSPPPQQPELTAKAKLVLQHRKHPPQQAPPQRRRSSVLSRSSSVSAGSSWNRRRRPSSGKIPEAASFSESHWLRQVSRSVQDNSSSSQQPLTPPAPAFAAPWTAVAFNAAKTGFILHNFGLSFQ